PSVTGRQIDGRYCRVSSSSESEDRLPPGAQLADSLRRYREVESRRCCWKEASEGVQASRSRPPAGQANPLPSHIPPVPAYCTKPEAAFRALFCPGRSPEHLVSRGSSS